MRARYQIPLVIASSLTTLSLASTSITSLEPLKGMISLTWLYLDGTGLQPLKGLTSLTSLDLTGATGITSLEPLKGKRIYITDVSRELFATMK